MIAVKKERRPIIWQPTEKQREVLAAPEREILYGGALGGGKTDCLCACALSQIGNARHRAIFFRKSFPQLRSVIKRLHELFRPLGGIYNVQTSTFLSKSIVFHHSSRDLAAQVLKTLRELEMDCELSAGRIKSRPRVHRRF